MKRRNLLQAMLIAGIAPAIVKSGVLMPVKDVILPNYISYKKGDTVWFGMDSDFKTGRLAYRGLSFEDMDHLKRPRSEKIMLV